MEVDDRVTRLSTDFRRGHAVLALVVYSMLLAGLLAAGSITAVWFGTTAARIAGLGGILVVWTGWIGFVATSPTLARRGVNVVGLSHG